MTVEFLRALPLFAGLNDGDLDWLIANAMTRTVGEDEFLIREGEPGASMFIVTEGEFEVTKRSENRDVVITRRKPGEVIGEMSLVDQSPRSASIRACRESTVLEIPQEVFHQLLSTSPTAALAVLHTFTARLRQNQALLQQSEKMAALGTLSAGLAHELNNPAAALRRAADQLAESLNELQTRATALAHLDLDPPQKEAVDTLRGLMSGGSGIAATLDPLARSDMESDLQTWLEDRGVDDAWELAPALGSAGLDVPALSRHMALFTRDQMPVVARWLGGACAVYGLVRELSLSAERISEIVKAVKSYSYLDQAPVQQVELTEGLENTLVILRHKMKSGVNVTRQYSPDLPRIEAYGSELNQVWTNLIDNAIDAMQGKGELKLRAFGNDGHVVVEIEDNGSGIPKEILPRLFEAFYTTKPPGVGTGLGLHIAYNIVAKHAGEIKISSRPGSTCFTVILPIQLKKG